MGSAVNATCTCGLATQVLVGGGMLTFETTCYFPCHCRQCRNVVQVNLLGSKKQCPHCRARHVIPYDSPELSGSPGKEVIAEWNVEDRLGRNLALTDGTYECPRCETMSLRFSCGGVCWD